MGNTLTCCICDQPIHAVFIMGTINGKAHRECVALGREEMEALKLQMARARVMRDGVPEAVREQNKQAAGIRQKGDTKR